MNKGKVNVQMLEPQPTNGIRTIDTTSSQTIAKPIVSRGADEYILCAAVHYDDNEFHEHSPSGISNGYVVCGWRHHNCITLHFDLTNEPTRESARQGFLTNKNRFVGRSEAAEIAFKSGQIKTEIKTLFSEDVW